MADTKIKKIKLSETEVYDIADPAAANNDYQFLQYKGVALEAQIKAQTSPKVGDYWYAGDTKTSWLCRRAPKGTIAALWTPMGNYFVMGVNGVSYGNNAGSPAIYAPLSVGTKGQVLTSSGDGEPKWSDVAGGGPDIVISASQPSGQKSGDFWYQIVT